MPWSDSLDHIQAQCQVLKKPRITVHHGIWRELLIAERDNVVHWKIPKGRSMMVSTATNLSKESRRESVLGCAGCTSIHVWFVCDLIVSFVQAVSDCAFGDLCVCVWCGLVQSQLV